VPLVRLSVQNRVHPPQKHRKERVGASGVTLTSFVIHADRPLPSGALVVVVFGVHWGKKNYSVPLFVPKANGMTDGLMAASDKVVAESVWQ